MNYNLNNLNENNCNYYKTSIINDNDIELSEQEIICDGDENDINPDIHLDILFTIALLTPDGRYEVILDNDNPIRKSPIVQFMNNKNLYLSELDTKRLYWGLNQVRKILHTSPLKEVVIAEISPGHENEWTEEQFIEWVNCFYYYLFLFLL